MIPSSTWSSVTTAAELDLPSAQSDDPNVVAVPIAIRPVSTSLPYVESLGPGTTTGRLDRAWHAVYWEGGNVKLIKMEGNAWGAPSVLFSETSQPEKMALTFDQLGRPIVFYSVSPSTLKLFFYDTSLSSYSTEALTTGKYPVAGFDTPENTSDPNSDALLFYVRDDRIYMRVQRDRFLIEYDTGISHPSIKLYGCGRRKDRRFQVSYRYKAPT